MAHPFKLWLFPPRRLMPRGDEEKYNCRRRQMLLEIYGKQVWLPPYCGFLTALALSPKSEKWSSKDIVRLFWPDPEAQPDYATRIVQHSIATTRKLLSDHGMELVVQLNKGWRVFSIREVRAFPLKFSDHDIHQQLKTENIVIEPRPPIERINGASVDLLLGPKFRTFDGASKLSAIDLSGNREITARQIERVMNREIDVGQNELFYLHPGEMALGATLETVTLPNDIVGCINGRSSLARLGLMVHITAHEVAPGWSGQLVLEFYNSGKVPLGLRPGMPICSISFEPLSSPATRPYNKRPNAKYAGQIGPVASRVNRDAAE